MRGRFITLEGTEGCGKSTQARRLADQLEARGVRAMLLREPGGTATGELLRGVLQHDAGGEPLAGETELLLFAASRAQLVRQVVLPTLDKGTWVLCDRFIDSTTAYQGYGRGFDLATVAAINGFATGGLEPDLTFWLHLDLATGMERMRERNRLSGGGEDRFEREALAFHERVLQGYATLARTHARRFRVLDGRDSVEAIAAAIWAEVAPLVAVEGRPE